MSHKHLFCIHNKQHAPTYFSKCCMQFVAVKADKITKGSVFIKHGIEVKNHTTE